MCVIVFPYRLKREEGNQLKLPCVCVQSAGYYTVCVSTGGHAGRAEWKERVGEG